MDAPHFDVVRPRALSPVVVDIPHAGVAIDAMAAVFTQLPAVGAAADAVVADSDVGADAVWLEAKTEDATLILARASRYVIDLNTEPRLPTAYEEKLPAPLRTVRVRSECGVVFEQNPAPLSEIERRVRDVFEPYHAAIAVELEIARARFGRAVLLSFHTFPDRYAPTADVVVGTRHGESAPAALRDAVAAVFREAGLRVALEAPFPGGYSLARHGRPASGACAVQVELARRLVCDARDRITVDGEAVRRVARMLPQLVFAAKSFAIATTATVG